jgi:hypothetical protein
MTKEELIKELELLADSCDSNYALEMNGYNRGVLDALSVVNKYFALAPVSSSYDKPDWSNGCDCGQMSCLTCHG